MMRFPDEYYETPFGGHLDFVSNFVQNNNIQTVFETGVEHGHSTLAWLRAGAEVWSVDIHECPIAKRRVEEAGFSDRWNFVKENSAECGRYFPPQCDLLFLDSDHTPGHVYRELCELEPRIRPNGYLMLHDFMFIGEIWGGVTYYLWQHVRDEKDVRGDEFSEWDMKIRMNSNGLAILRKPR